MIKQGVSIIICCHNSAARLPQTIKHIAAQVVPSYISWEFIIVNNGSTDNTAEVAKTLWFQYNTSASFKIVSEPQLGLNFARVRGFQEAQYEFVIMCDDDNWLSCEYVKTAYRIMCDKPNVAALGGFGKLVFENDPPDWIRYSHIFAAGPQSATSGKVLKNRVYGAGCVIRKSAYMKIRSSGFKSLLIDRKGNELSSGGDYELCYAFVIMGYDIWYDERLKFLHFITKERLSWEYFLRYARESSTCFVVLTPYKMIAMGSRMQNFSSLVIAKDFSYCLKEFFQTNMRRFLADPESVSSKLLYFKHIELKHKLLAYVRQFKTVASNHERVLHFKQRCAAARATKTSTEFSLPEFKPSFASKLFRQPQ